MNPISETRISRIAALFALASVAACGGGSGGTSPGASDVAGTYSLRSYKGAPLPILIGVQGANTKTLLDDTYTLNADSRFTQLWHVELFFSGAKSMQTVGDTGVFERSGSSTIRFTGLGRSVLVGDVRNDTLRVFDETGVLIYTK
jgi:hypothetical protein